MIDIATETKLPSRPTEIRKKIDLRPLLSEATGLIRNEQIPQIVKQAIDLTYKLAVRQNISKPIQGREQERYGIDKFPNYLTHLEEVYSVVRELLVKQSPPERRIGAVMAYTHDLGRAVTMKEAHAVLGAMMLREMAEKHDTIPADTKRLIDIAHAHHCFGLGAVFKDTFTERARKAIGKPEDSEGETVGKIYQEAKEKFGLAGIALMLADVSKAYKDPRDLNMSMIWKFDEQVGQELLDRQVKRGVYKKGEKKYIEEETGMTLLSRIIPLLEKDLDTDYGQAISNARGRYTSEGLLLVKERWNAAVKAYEKEQADEIPPPVELTAG